VNMIFFMGGPQLGELEAGLMAAWAGPVVSVVTGGIGCIAATLWVAAVTPGLRAYRRTPPASPVDIDPSIPAGDDRQEGRTGEL